MTKWRAALLGFALLAACETTPPPSEGPQEPLPEPADVASGCEALVPIEAQDTAAGKAAELSWLGERYPGFVITNQTTLRCDGVPVDRVAFTQDGQDHVVMFDTSAFFGKVGEDDLNDLLEG
ncbi:hypothetical protein [Parvularcula dongshanensis]|uniref:Lipoprotein n=1 Tax=Parvularcula dongshanensis TaxID=1173995 RepID=A0A840I626_9PROT|nr:hypothetical protein [Parvularcula dongshanensis]MBB4659721.1 hypothetical protein [Parvularcula dongshanensis]